MKTLAPLASLSALVLGSSLGAQGLLATSGEVIAKNGDAAPGIPGVTFDGSGTFGTTVIDESGGVFVKIRLVGAGVTSLNETALFYGTSASDLQLVIRAEDPAPGIPGATLNHASFDSLSSSPRLSPDGRMLWGSTINDGGVTIDSTNDTVMYVGTPGSWTIAAREGDPAPGIPGATLKSSFSSPSQQSTGLDRFGRLLYKSSLGGAVTTDDDNAWFFGLPGSLAPILREGDASVGGTVIQSLGFVSQTNEGGMVVLDARLSQTLGTSPASDLDDQILVIHVEGFGNTVVLREGDIAPGTAGGVFGKPGGSWFVNTGANTFNAFGEFAMIADITGGDVVANVNDRAIYLINLGTETMLVRRGDPAPGTDASLDVFNNSSLSLNLNGEVAFQSTLIGGTATSADDACVYTTLGGTLHLVAREGDPAPELPGHTIGSMFGHSMFMNNNQIHMNIPVTETASGTNKTALYIYDKVLGMCLATVGGEQIEVAPGVFKTVSSFGGSQFNNTNGAPLSFDHDGNFALRVNFTDGTAAVTRTQACSLRGAPSTISESAGGAQTLFLNAGSDHGNDLYLLLGSFSGTSPGLPADGHILPLNFDAYLNHTLSKPNKVPLTNSFAALDGTGRSTATFTLPAGLTGFSGLTAHHAFAVVDLGSLGISFTSEAAPVTFLP